MTCLKKCLDPINNTGIVGLKESDFFFLSQNLNCTIVTNNLIKTTLRFKFQNTLRMPTPSRVCHSAMATGKVNETQPLP